MIALTALLFLATPEDLKFVPWVVDDGVAVSTARSESATPWIRGVAEIAAPAGRVFALLGDYGGYASLFAPVVRKSAVIEPLEGGARVHLVWSYPFPFRNRDAIVRYETESLADGAYRLFWKGDPKAGDPAEGVRIRRVAGETRIEPLSAGRCRVTYTFFGDLGGSFPKAAEEKAWRREPVDYLLAVRRRLETGEPVSTGPAGSGPFHGRRTGKGIDLFQDRAGADAHLVVFGQISPPDGTRRIDEELGGPGDVGVVDTAFLVQQVEAPGHDRSLVREHWKRVPLLGREFRRDGRRVDADSHDPGLTRPKLWQFLLQTP